MAGRNDGLIKSFKAATAIAAHRIVKFGAADTEASLATAAADLSIGLSIEIDAAIGERVDVAMSDIGDVTYGGNVTRGDMLTADATGRAITAAPAANAAMRTIGIALVSAVAGDIGPCRIAPGLIRG